MLRIINATIEDLNGIDKLYTNCIQSLNKKGIFQWDDRYPNIETYKNSINNKSQYIIMDDDELVGAVILNEIQAEEWDKVSWNYKDEKALIIHALAINTAHQGKGYGQRVLELCHTYGIDNGYKVIRLDAFSENPAAINLYEKNGYKKTGEVTFDTKPEGHQLYFCYDKLLK